MSTCPYGTPYRPIPAFLKTVGSILVAILLVLCCGFSLALCHTSNVSLPRSRQEYMVAIADSALSVASNCTLHAIRSANAAQETIPTGWAQ